jgi:uncharacterized protein YbaA (DUF1428 family)
MKNKTLIPIILGLIAVFAGLFILFHKKVEAPDKASAIAGWHTYTDKQLGFEVQYPDDWQVYATTTYFLPIINVYKKGETIKPPFTINSTTTQVGIFPRGFPTEAPLSQAATNTWKISAPLMKVHGAWHYVLEDKTPWGTVARFATTTAPVSWTDENYIFAGVTIKDQKDVCIKKDGTEVPTEKCDLGVESIGVKYVKRGSVNSEDWGTEKKIVESFRFVK